MMEPGIVRTFMVDAPPDIVYEVLSDFKGYPLFLSKVIRCYRVRDQVQYRLKMLAHGPEVQYTLKIKENKPQFFTWALAAPTPGDRSTNHFVENSGSWKLIPVVTEDNRTQTEVTYTSMVVLRPPVPKWVSRNLQLKAVPQLHQEFTQEAERRYKVLVNTQSGSTK
jgi:uncharacterized membrane protein